MLSWRTVLLSTVGVSLDSWHDDSLSLLQLRAQTSKPLFPFEELPPGGNEEHHCCLYMDPHVQSVFPGGRNIETDRPNFNHAPGVNPLAKSSDGSIQMQMFTCPLARESESNDSGEGGEVGFTQVQAAAVKAGDDVIEIAYKPFSPQTTWLENSLPGKSAQEIVDSLIEICGWWTDAVRLMKKYGLNRRDWDYYVYAADLPDGSLFDNPYKLMKKVIGGDKVCKIKLMGVPIFPLVYLNGVEVYSPLFDDGVRPFPDPAITTADNAEHGLSFGSGYHLLRTGEQLPGVPSNTKFNLYHDDRRWQLAWKPTAQTATSERRGRHTPDDLLDFNKTWTYLDPMWEVAVWIRNDLLSPDRSDGETLCGATGGYPMTQIPFEDSFFSTQVAQQICDTCNWSPGEGQSRVTWHDGTTIEGLMPSCVVPPAVPEPPSPPPPAAVCEGSDVPYADAENACSHLVHHERNYAECIMDYCVSDGNPEVPAMEETIAEEQEPLPECVGSECDPVIDCTNDLQLNLAPPTHNNLGGLGPDSGRESIVYANVATFEGRTLDLVVRDIGGTYKAAKPEINGVTGPLGTIAVKAGSSANLEFKIVDTSTGEAVALPSLALTILDLDTGKKGKGAESVEVCGTDSAMVAEGSELGQVVSADCTKFTATTVGNGADNPSSALDLSPAQAKRVATYTFRNLDTFKVTFEVSKGWGQRPFLFAFHPGIACLGS